MPGNSSPSHSASESPSTSRKRSSVLRPTSDVLSYCLGRETLLAEGASEGVGIANHVPWWWQRRRRRRAPRSTLSHHAPRHALLRQLSEVGRLSGTSPRSRGVHARRSQWPRALMICGPPCRASFLFLFLLQLPSLRTSSSRTWSGCALDARFRAAWARLSVTASTVPERCAQAPDAAPNGAD